MPGPLLTLKVNDSLCKARDHAQPVCELSLDLGRTQQRVDIGADRWHWNGADFPYIDRCKDRTVYQWMDAEFHPIARYGGSLIKLVPTDWGPPTFEIDGIKMLPTAKLSPMVDAQNKVGLIDARGKQILDCCGGLGYFAASCIEAQAKAIHSFEKNADVIWLRELNPWSPAASAPLSLTHGDIREHLPALAANSFDAILHDPPRFGIAGELYSLDFYLQLARVLKRQGRLFHYTGSPNKLTSGRDLGKEVSRRLAEAGFSTKIVGDGVLATKR